MPKGKAKEATKKQPVQRWTARKWAESKGEKYVRALTAAGPGFAKRIMTAHAAIQKQGEITNRIARLKAQLEKLEGSVGNGQAELEMEECEKILIGIVNTLPGIPAKAAKPVEEPVGAATE